MSTAAMKTATVFTLLVGLAATTQRHFNFTVFGVGDPIVYAGQQNYHFQPIPSYQNILLSKLTYDTYPDTSNHFSGNPYISGYNHAGYRPLAHGNSPFSLYFRPHSSVYFDISGLPLNSDIPRQFYASQSLPHLTPQNLDYFSQLHTSRLYPHFRDNNLIQEFNHFFNLIRKMYSNFNKISNGPVTVLMKSKEDPTKLVAVFVEHGLQTLGWNPNTVPLLKTVEASTGVKTAFLFNPVNTPVPSEKISVSDYIIPSGMTLAQFANLAIKAPNTPFLLLIDDNMPLVSDIKSLYQTFKIGSIEITDSVTVIPQFPVQPVVPLVQTGYYQPQSSVSYQSPVLTDPAESFFSSSSVASTAAVSQAATSENTPQDLKPSQPATSSASKNTPQNLKPNQLATSPVTGNDPPNLNPNKPGTSFTSENAPKNLNPNQPANSSPSENTPQDLKPNRLSTLPTAGHHPQILKLKRAATSSVSEKNPQNSNIIQLESSSISNSSAVANGLNIESNQDISHSSAV